jgi:hypothetical protein
MANVLYVIHISDLLSLLRYAMNAIMGTTRADALYAAELALLMRIIAENVFYKKKTYIMLRLLTNYSEMVVLGS